MVTYSSEFLSLSRDVAKATSGPKHPLFRGCDFQNEFIGAKGVKIFVGFNGERQESKHLDTGEKKEQLPIVGYMHLLETEGVQDVREFNFLTMDGRVVHQIGEMGCRTSEILVAEEIENLRRLMRK